MRDVDPGLLVETEERTELRAVMRDLFAAMCTPEDVRKHVSTVIGYDEALWSRMATEIGVQGLVIPEEYGGSGCTFAELAVVLEESGRALLCAPLLPTVLAAFALLLSGDRAACARHLPEIAAGRRTATVAGFEDHGRLTAMPGPGGWAGHGAADFVLHGHGADLILVAARTPEGLGLFACEGEAPGLAREARPVLDGTRPQALITLRDTPLIPIGEAGAAAAVVGRVLDIGCAALAAEQVGGSAHALDAIVSYVRQRHQFGRPIGSFQAVKHRLADLLVELEAARSAAAYAAACIAVSDAIRDDAPGAASVTASVAGSSVDRGVASPGCAGGDSPDESAVAASAAQVVCGETFRRAAAEYVQLHGGIGFTWEHPAHLYVRRARASEVLFGTPDDHRVRLAGLLGLLGLVGGADQTAAT